MVALSFLFFSFLLLAKEKVPRILIIRLLDLISTSYFYCVSKYLSALLYAFILRECSNNLWHYAFSLEAIITLLSIFNIYDKKSLIVGQSIVSLH